MSRIKIIYNPLTKEEQERFDKSQKEFYNKYMKNKAQKGEEVC